MNDVFHVLGGLEKLLGHGAEVRNDQARQGLEALRSACSALIQGIA